MLIEFMQDAWKDCYYRSNLKCAVRSTLKARAPTFVFKRNVCN